MEEITLKDALDIMDKTAKDGRGLFFNIAFRSLNRNSKTGGKLYKYQRARKYRRQKGGESKRLLTTPKDFKNPSHYKNRTRNIELIDGSIKKIHIRLITEFNGKKVIY